MTDHPMTVRDLIRELLKYPMDVQPYIGKGMGPCCGVHAVASGPEVVYVVLSPANEASGG